MIIFFGVLTVLIIILAYFFGWDIGYQKGFNRAEQIFKNDRNIHGKMWNRENIKVGR